MCKVSIIIPVFNTENYLRRCLDALHSQTYKDIEVLCIDDGSTDSSAQIIADYSQLDSRIKLIQQKNSGPAAARNNGLKNASGEFIMFCDSDDWYEPEMVEEMVATIQKEDVDVAICDIIVDSTICKERPKGDLDYYRLEFEGHKDISMAQGKACVHAELWNKIFRKSKIEEYNITFPDGFKSDDYSFLMQYLAVSKCAYGLNLKLYNYFLREESIMWKIFNNKCDYKFDFLHALKYTLNFLNEHNFDLNYWLIVYNWELTFWWTYLNKNERKKALSFSHEIFKDIDDKYIENNKFYKKLKQNKIDEAYKMFKKSKKISFLQRIFSLKTMSKNEKEYKVLRLLGLKFKFRQKNRELYKSIEILKEQILFLQKESERDNLFLKKLIRSLRKKTEFPEFITCGISSEEEEKKTIRHKFADFNLSEQEYLSYIKNMDEESIDIFNEIIIRLKKVLKSQDCDYEKFYNSKELENLTKLKSNFYDKILKVSDNLYAYSKYILPANHFEPSVFYFKHGLNLINTENIKNKDIIDVGGFIGDSVLIFSELTNKKVYTFEPIKENYKLLNKTLELNNITNAISENIALGNESGTIKMCAKDSASRFLNAPPVAEYEIEENIKRMTLDEYAALHDLDIGLIKVDIEGAEQMFIEGAKNTIINQKPVLLLSIYHCSDDFKNIKSIIESWNLGYKFKLFKPYDGRIVMETLLICEV